MVWAPFTASSSFSVRLSEIIRFNDLEENYYYAKWELY